MSSEVVIIPVSTEPCSMDSNGNKILNETENSVPTSVHNNNDAVPTPTTETLKVPSEPNPFIVVNNPRTIPKPENTKTGWRRYLGQFLTLIYVLAYTLAALILKKLQHYHPFCLGVWRFQGILLPSVVLLFYHGFFVKNDDDEENQKKLESCDPKLCSDSDVKTIELIEEAPLKSQTIFSTVWPVSKNWKTIVFLLIRGILGTTAILLFVFSLQYISIADSMVVTSNGPVFITILAYFCLKERFGWFSIFLAFLSLTGIVVICRPPVLTGAAEFDTETMTGCAFAFGSLMLSVVTFVIIRYLKDVHFAIITFTFGTLGSIQCLILSLTFGVLTLPENSTDALLALALAVLTFIAQVSLTSALKVEEAGPVSIIRTTNVIFSFIWQFIFLGIVPDVYSLLGAGIVFFSIIATLFRKWLKGRPQSHRARKYLFFVLK